MGDVLSGIFGSKSDYQAGNPLDVDGAYGDQIRNTYSRNAQVYNSQVNLANQLADQVAGNGPNPSQIQYKANTENNINNAQGLIASQRGLNPALAARLGSNAAIRANQQASLGSALLQQQQQLAAQQQLSSLYDQMGRNNLGYQGLLTGAGMTPQQINAETSAGNARNAGALSQAVIGGYFNALGGIGGAAAGGMSQGGKVPGKADKGGDSYDNDTVPAMLSPGEIVVPRSQTQSAEKAKEFIDHLMKQKSKKKLSYVDVLKAKKKRD